MNQTPDDALAISPGDLPPEFPIDVPSLKTEDDFGKAAFGLLKETSMALIYLFGRVPPTPYSRNEAIRRGLLKRLNLLAKSLLCDISNNSGYQQLQISRQIVETASNYLYLADDGPEGKRHDAFILNSLAEEKANLRFIAEQVKARGGEPMPIETRMRRSMERMATTAGFELDSVPRKRDTGWPNSEERLKNLSPTAYPSYRSGSSALHAGWSILLLQDIQDVDGGFSLDNSIGPRVPPMTSAIQILAETSLHYLDQEGDELEKEYFWDRLIRISGVARALDEAHEAFMQQE